MIAEIDAEKFHSNGTREANRPEPIAIVGIGCRFPGGVRSASDFWSLLRGGVDAISEIPADRWSRKSFFDPDPSTPGRTYARWGGFIDDIDRFDAQFFGIAPREAAYMDPQQRLLLEVCWEALENAGQRVDDLRGSETGVFVGISTHDYGDIQTKDIYSSDFYANTGGALSIAANRISYVLNFRGPSMAVDTACSSSLVAVHLACRSLQEGECRTAVVGGVNCIIAPETTITFSKGAMLSPDGRCKAFDSRANGYVRGEGAGVVILKHLSQAVEDGDRVYAVISATAVNQDGRTHGITVPSQNAQETLLRDAYRRAGVSADEVLYVEAHGTGTPVGDPIEAHAIGAVLGAGRAHGSYLRLGSVKSNIGHLEAASGIAGLIKAALVLQNREIPASLHFQQPNPGIHFEDLNLRVQRENELFPETGRNVVGVNSFGFGGTNAHVVLEGVRQTAVKSPQEVEPSPKKDYLLPLSARSPEALRALAKAFANFLADEKIQTSVSLADLCYTASMRRSQHDYRLALAGGTLQELATELQSYSSQNSSDGANSARTPGHKPKVAFVFSGMGPQWWAMGRELLKDEPVFRAKVEECDRLFVRYAGWSILRELAADEAHSRMADAEVAQPANFVIQMGLAALWAAWGVLPDAVIGHSAGEVAAAAASGALSLDDAVRLIYHRSRLQQRATSKGSMLAVGVAATEADSLLAGFENSISVAAINSPQSLTLSGDTEPLQELARSLEAKQVFCRFLDVRVPYHSHHMDPLRDELLESLGDLQPVPGPVPLYSSMTGAIVDGRELHAGYWWKNVREPVRFADATGELLDAGYDTFVEVGPHPVLGRSVLEILAKTKKSGVVLPSLRRERERRTLLESLGTLYSVGQPVCWQSVAPETGRYIDLPGYQWCRERYWHESEFSSRHRLGNRIHPLLERKIESANPTWETNLALPAVPYLEDHCVQGSIVYPAAAYIEMTAAAARQLGAGPALVLEEIEFRRALALQKQEVQQIQFIFDEKQESFGIYSRLRDSGQPWILHATGRVQAKGKVPPPRRLALAEIQERCKRQQSHEYCYELMSGRGLQYGERFRGVETLWYGDKEALGRIRIPESVVGERDDYELHPAVLDSCFHVFMGTVFAGGGDRNQGTYLPVRIGRVLFHKRVEGDALWSYVRLVHQDANTIEGEVLVLNNDGETVAEITGFKCQHLPDARTGGDWSRCLYELRWYAKALPGAQAARHAEGLSSPSAIGAGVLSPTEVSLLFDRKRHYEDVEPQLERLCAAYGFEALTQLGWKPRKGEGVETAALVESLQIAPQHRQLTGRLLEILSEDGYLSKTERGWTVREEPGFSDAGTTWKQLVEKYPDYDAVLSILGRCGSHLADVLRGTQEPLQLIFPEASMDDLQQGYEESPYNRVYNYLVGQAVEAAVAALPTDRTLRVLEIGAGTGGTTAHVLPVLPQQRTEYTFTDVSHVFTALGSQKFCGYPFVDFRLLDIDQDTERQGFQPHSFDLIVASNVLHATRDLRATLENIRGLLSPSGLLVIMEFTRASRVLDLVFGMLRDWWKFEDTDLRGSHPWLSRAGWNLLLRESGCDEVVSLADASDSVEPFQTVFVARGPALAPEAPGAVLPQMAPGGHWLVLSDQRGVGNNLAEQLAAHEQAVTLVSVGPSFSALGDRRFVVRPESAEDFMSVLETIGGQLRGVVHLWSLDTPEPEDSGAFDLELNRRLGCLSALQLLQSMARATLPDQPRLWLVTRGAQEIGPGQEPVRIAQAPLWGLGRVIANEQSHLRCTLLDLDPDEKAPAARLLQELAADETDQEITWRGSSRYVARIVRPLTLAAASQESDVPRNGDGNSFYLEAAKPGILDSLQLREIVRREPGPDEVEIKIETSGLNFRDVMKAMGLYPIEDGEKIWLGDECAGRIVRVGPGVDDRNIGDEVLAIAPGTLRSFATVPKDYVVSKPAHLSFDEAASIPIVFLTAHYALNYLARLTRGERILIHSAAGGVGLAALQIARNAGAEIFATAGTPEKREYLKSLGVEHVMDSRTQLFASEIMDITHGKGVSVILNSLAGDFIRSGLSVLEPTGRFLELGKIDIYQNSRLNMGHFKKGLSFFAVDLGWLLQNRPAFAQSLFADVIAMFRAKTLAPLPVRTFPITDASGCFRYMAQARHIGKVALSLNGHQHFHVTAAPNPAALVHKNATYLISGGLGGFGLAMGAWLIEQGAENLVLMGRSGSATPEVEQKLASLRQAGARIHVAKVDVTDLSQVQNLLEEIDGSMPPVRGVIHAAMVLDDGFLTQLTEERFARVMAPKVAGAWNLHAATIGTPLDFFVSFSSVSSLTGAPGQANYCAANAFLDAFSHYRRSRNLPALTVNWGAIADVGYVARNVDVGRYLERQGLQGLKPQEAGAILGQLLAGHSCQVGVIRGDFQKLVAAYASGPVSRRLAHVLHQESLNGAGAGTQQHAKGDMLAKIREAEPPERFELVQTLIRQGIAKVLKTPAARIEPDVPLASLGLDSLMAVELEILVEEELGVDLSLGFLAGGGVTLAQLTTRLLEQVEEKQTVG